MTQELRAWLAAAALLGAVGGAASAQPTLAVRAPHAIPDECVEADPAPIAPDPWEVLAPVGDPRNAPPPDASFEDHNGPLLVGDPFLDPGRFSGAGLFGAVQTTILSPFYTNKLTGPVTIPGVGAVIVRVPTADFAWTVAPEFSLGYRFGEGAGELVLTYRFLIDEGTTGSPSALSTGDALTRGLLGLPAGVPPFLPVGPGSTHSRLNVHVAGIDYRSREYGLGPKWDLRWLAGVWFVSNYFDSQVHGTLLDERVSSYQFAVGPHVGLELWRWLSPQPGRGLALYGKAETAFATGRTQQNFEASVLAGGVPVAGGAAQLTGDPLGVPGNNGSQWVPIVRVQFGVNWAPDWGHDRLRFTGGYEFEGWWSVGRLPSAGASVGLGSEGTLTNNGILWRAEWKY
ncbi:hypothetical protein AYO40_05115 [Planctomycetaceae bacterium SCGC AG-212-D15]|nr:hypothetical protein AYO40_05115 [Planctomycetaceae bacterium SCGC AG-212-D15]